MYQSIFEITPEIEQHFDSPLRVKAEATVEAIALSKSINQATPQQKLELAKASGWGTLTDIWVKANHQGNTWQHRCHEKLSHLLTQTEIQSAKSATATAYQTSFEVIRAMWDLLSDIGFTGGAIIEPACNTLAFMGCQPTLMRERSQWVGIELDPIFAQIAKLLYPEALIYAQGFETVSLGDNSFDLAIGNVPFGNYKLYDPRYAHLNLSVHNYFLAKCVDLVRENGLIALITSCFTMDAANTIFRRYLASKLELVTAIRLPDIAFKRFANTEVVADILIFRKRSETEQMVTNHKNYKYPDWVKIVPSGKHTVNQEPIMINQWFME
ncbi:MAG: SAM-dependent methyltransferase [Pseudanabaena sp.]